MAALRAGLLAGCALLAGGAASFGQELDAVEREWRLRRWALLPNESVAEWERASQEADWRERRDVLVALERAQPFVTGEESRDLEARARSLALAGFDDPHPNVRAAALSLARPAGLLGEADPLKAETLERLLEDPLPEVRLRLVEHEAAEGSTRAALALARLARDPDPRVASSARASLATCAAAWLVPELVPLCVEAVESGGIELLLQFERVRLDPRLWEEPLASAGPGGAREAERQALRAAFGAQPDARALLTGWLPSEPWDPRRRGLLARGLVSAGEGALALLEEGLSLVELALAGDSFPLDPPAWPALEASLRGREALALERLRDEWLIAWASLAGEDAAARLAASGWSAESQRSALTEIGRRRFPLGESGRAWLADGVPRSLRLACVEAAAASFERHPGEAQLLVAGASDPDEEVAEQAFAALMRSGAPGPWLAGAAAAWSARPWEARLTWLEHVPAYTPVPFRDALLELGAAGTESRTQALDWLARFSGDRAVTRALEAWLREDLARLEAASPPTRTFERAFAGELRVFARVAGAAAVPTCEAALAAADGHSVEVGKVAAALLGASEAGRERLAARLPRLVDTRTRIEAAIALAPWAGPAAEAASRVLFEELERAEPGLWERMMQALGSAHDAPSLAALEAWVATPSTSPRRRVAAIDALAGRALARRGRASVPAALLEVARDDLELPARLAAIRALARFDAPETRALFGELVESAGAEAAADEVALLVEGEALRAWQRSAGLPPLVLPRVLGAAREEASRLLLRRFRTNGSYRGPRPSVDPMLVGELARSGGMTALLEASGDWWQLDAALLRLLAEAVPPDDPNAPLLARALRIATAADRGVEARGARTWASLRLLDLAVEAREDARVAALAAELHRSWVRGELAEGLVERSLGPVDPVLGSDPTARLATLALQAAAHDALERGDHEAAHAYAERARFHLGRSSAARQAQARLERELSAKR